MREVRRAPVRRDTSGREVGHTRPPRSPDDPDVRPDRDRPGPARRQGALDRRLAPRGPGRSGSERARGGPPQPDLVDLRRAPRLLGLADLERQRRRSCWRRASTFTPQQLFFLVALPNLVGSLLRLPYTFAVPRFGGRNWTMVSAALLLVPTLLFACAVQHPDTPYWVFCLIAATAGLGGGNFASLDGEHQLLLPGRQEGRRARPQRRGRQPRRRADPALPAGDRRRRRHLRPGQGQPTAASTSSARPACTPGWRSSRRWRRTSSWTT